MQLDNIGKLGKMFGCLYLLATLPAYLHGAETPTAAQVLAKYGNVPIGFEANKGQADANVRFLAHNGRSTLLLTPNKAILKFDQSQVSMQIVDAKNSPELAAADRQAAKTNYFLGNDPKHWVTDVPRYGRVNYSGIYDRVNLSFYGNGRELEYDWVILPGGDPNRIRTRYEGVDSLRVDANGDLVLSTKDGELRHRKPLVYQTINGKKKQIEGVFALRGKSEVGFRVGAYDRTQPLTVDPILAYASYLGGSKVDQAYGVAVDNNGSAYVTGNTNSLNFPALPVQSAPAHVNGSCKHDYYSSTNRDFTLRETCNDIFVSKFNQDGTLAYSTYIGGSGDDGATGIAVDASGNAYIAGASGSSDFPPVNAVQPQFHSGPNGDAVLFKLDPTGSRLLFSTYFGGSGSDDASGIALDVSGVYITGNTFSSDFHTVGSIYPFVAPDLFGNAFIAKFRVDGSLIYSTFVCDHCKSNSIDVDANGVAYIVGAVQPNANAIHTNAKSYQRNYVGGDDDAFALALDPGATTLLYSTYLGGGADDEAKVIKVDRSSGIAIVGGITFGPATSNPPFNYTPFPTTPTAFQASRKVCLSGAPCTGSGDGFVVKLGPPTGAQPGNLLASTLIGGTQMANNSTGAAASTIYVSSQTGQYITGFNQNANVALLPLNISGQPISIATDLSGNVYTGVFPSGAAGDTVQKFTAGGLSLGTFATLPANVSGPFGLALDPAGNLYVSSLTNNVIEKFDSQGHFIGTLAAINSPRGLMFDPFGTLFVVSSFGSGAVYEITDLTTLNQSPNPKITTGFADPRYAAFDQNGALLVSNTNGGDFAGYIQKYTLDNGAMTASTRYASGLRGPNGLGFDALGNLYVAEYFGNDIRKYNASGIDQGVFKSNITTPNGLTVINAPGQGVPFETKVFGLTFDPQGNIFASGYTICTDAIFNVAAVQPANAGGEDVFILKFNSNLSGPLLFSSYFGGTGDDWAHGMTSDASGGIYVVGYTTQPTSQSTGFPSTARLQTTFGGGLYDGFIVKLANADIAISPFTFTRLATSSAATAAIAEAPPPVTAFGHGYNGNDSGRTAGVSTAILNMGGGSAAENPAGTGMCPDHSKCTCSSETGTCSVQDNMFTVTMMGSLPQGSSVPVNLTITFDNTVPAGSPINLSMTGRSDTNDSNTSNNTMSSPSTITVGALVNFQVSGNNVQPGLNLNVDGTLYRAPFAANLDTTIAHTFCAPTPQIINGVKQDFVSWSNGITSFATPCITVPAQSLTASPIYTAAFNGITPPLSGLLFVPITPCRITDTRAGSPIQSTRDIPIQSSCNIPSTAQAYALNITAVPNGEMDYLSIWPMGQPAVVSTLNSYDGRVVANAAIVPAGTGGAVTVLVSQPGHVIIDINGYFIPSSGLAFYPVAPCRVTDTRNGSFLRAGTPVNVPISGSCGIPAASQAYSVNVTVVPHGPLGFLTAWPTGQLQPNVSTLNSYDGSIVANAAIVPAGTNGAVSFFATNDTDLIIDINGYFAPPGGSGALTLHTLPPCRVVDTRGAPGAFGGPTMSAGATRGFQMSASACGIPPSAQAYSLNATVVPPGPLSFLTAWPAGQAQPGVSTLNSYAGKVVANAAIVPAGTNGTISIFVTNLTQLILDINAYFAP